MCNLKFKFVKAKGREYIESQFEIEDFIKEEDFIQGTQKQILSLVDSSLESPKVDSFKLKDIEVKSPFNIGDTIYFIDSNKLKRKTIINLSVCFSYEGKIVLRVELKGWNSIFLEIRSLNSEKNLYGIECGYKNVLFTTKQEALAYIGKEVE